MKNILTSGFIITLLLLAGGCETDEKDPAGPRGLAVIPIISDIEPGIFDSKDLVNSFVGFNVSLEEGTSADKVEILGSYNGDLSRTKISEITGFPASVKIVSGDVIQKLGIPAADVVNGDVFTIELLTTGNGVTTRSNSALNISVACAFDEALTIGSYHSVSADWNSEGDITITADPDDPYTLYVSGLEEMEGLVEDVGPLEMHIDPATFEVVAGKSVLASDAWGYHNLAYEGTGLYNSCDGSFNMSFTLSVDEGSFGINGFVFTRN